MRSISGVKKQPEARADLVAVGRINRSYRRTGLQSGSVDREKSRSREEPSLGVLQHEYLLILEAQGVGSIGGIGKPCTRRSKTEMSSVAFFCSNTQKLNHTID